MKNYVLIICMLFVFMACKTEKKEDVKIEEEVAEVLAPISASDMETAVIYEANIRQYSTEGTFDEFTKDIPQLKELGVKIIWLMPVFPISETKRKATGGKFASEFPEVERSKYLGSYYAVTDFTKINPEFGTIEDFRELVKVAHDNGIYVILDWVPNHTGWDHEWLKSNPEYYTQNEGGEVIHPEGTDWTDVADLNYDNQAMRNEMIEDMTYWITDEGVDGFRCDVAGSVPLDFWQQAVPELRAKKDLFMLAEAWEPELLDGNLFDMAYGWDRHHRLNDMAKGENSAQIWNEQMQKDRERYDDDDILMTFVTNHDENSWNGTIKERMGDASEVLTALSYVAPGMPLIYSGQEYGLDHRLKFFEKDEIPHTKGKEWELLKKLGQLKATNKALHGGKNAASYELVTSNNRILQVLRKKGEDEVLFVANLSDGVAKTPIKKGGYLDYMKNKELMIDSINPPINLKPWEYKILIKQ